jgi:hypothetical protein
MESILTSIKKLLGIGEADTNFDDDIIMHINSVIFILTQLGVAPEKNFSIDDKVPVWDDYVPASQNLRVIRSYIYLRVRLLFDPPLTGVMCDIMKKQADEFEWRIMVNVDPKPVIEEVINYDV